MEAIEFNRELDAQLASNGSVDKAFFSQLLDAYTYDAATTVNWVEAKLQVLKNRVNSGASLHLYEPSKNCSIAAKNEEEFFSWASKHFPDAWPEE